jgi:signal transduction histidine kinase
MPEMTGVEFFMQAKAIQPEAVRILLTGYTDLESVISAINQGQIYRYITKPWEPEEFLGIVRQAIEVFEMKGTIARQNRELQQANAALKSLDKMKSDFMVLVNHELKTPLTGIFSFVQLLKEEKLAVEPQLYVEKIAVNTQRLQDLINDTLLITRLQANAESLTYEETDIHSLIKNQWQALSQRFAKRNHQLQIDPDQPFLQVVNQKYIEIVIKKLLHNSWVHGKEGATVRIALTDAKDYWEMGLQNPSEKPIEKNVDQLLSAFSTSENILNHSGGTGLGLAVTQGILHLFGGSIDISTENQIFDIQIQVPKIKQ